jgi:hypothetical protein
VAAEQSSSFWLSCGGQIRLSQNYHWADNHVVNITGNVGLKAGPAFAHRTTGAKRTVGAPHPPPQYIKTCTKKCEALQYCDSNEFIELTVGASRVLMS